MLGNQRLPLFDGPDKQLPDKSLDLFAGQDLTGGFGLDAYIRGGEQCVCGQVPAISQKLRDHRDLGA